MCCLLAAKYISRRIGPTEEAVLTLPLLAHRCAAMLSTYVCMCAKGAVLSAKSRICMSSAPSLRSFIVTYPVGLEEYNRHAWDVREKEERQTKYWTSGYRNNSPITDTNALVVPIQVGENSSNLQR